MEEKLLWNLDDIMKVKDFDRFYKETEELLAKYDEYFERLEPEMTVEEFKKLIDYEEDMGEKIIRLYDLPSLMESVDQKNQEVKLMKQKASDLYLKYSQKSRKISQWIKGMKVEEKPVLDDVNAKRLFESIPVLTYTFNYARQAAKYSLSLREEDIVLNKDMNGVNVLTDLRTLIETEFRYTFAPKGKEVRIISNQEELKAYVQSSDANERMAAYEGLLTKYKENIDKFFAIYQAVVKDLAYEMKLRGYKSPISMRNFDNQVPDEAIETLLEVCRKNVGIFQRYFRFKAKELGVTKLKREDIYAPLKSKNQNKYSLPQAWEIVEAAFGGFGEGYVARARQIIEERHIDSHPGENKISGAYCATVDAKITPYVLLNHTEEWRSVATMAHELGHGIHSLYANQLPSSVQHASLPLAETASITGEMILFETMYGKETDIQVKKAMLSEKISDSYASIIRQSYFTLFEIQAHKAIAKGVTAKELGKIWMETLTEQFGDSVEVGPLFEYEWSYIPYLVNEPFYSYAYNFGELLSLSLYARYKNEGKAFVPKLEKILAAGGSRNPEEVLKEVGINMRDSDFWQGSMEIIREWVDLLERMAI